MNPPSLTYPLNPVDFVLLVTHESLRQRGYCGLSVMVVVEAEGELDPRAVSEAARELGRTYPALSARLRCSAVLRRPRWVIDPAARPEEAVAYEHVRTEAGRGEDVDPLSELLDEPVDIRRGPQVKLVHLDSGDGRHRLGLRWAHPLMDFEGGHLLLRSLSEIMEGRPPTLGCDPRAVFPPPFEPRSLHATMRKVWRERWRYVVCDRHHQPRIVKKPEGAPQRCRLALRTYDAERRRRFEELAKERTAPGPLRYSRAMIVALGRAYLKMATDRGRPRPHYIFPLPLPLSRSTARPGVHGNYVTIPWVIFEQSELEDWGRADAAAARQFAAYHEQRMDEATWLMYRAATRWPLPVLSWLMSHRRPRAAAGHTGYQFDDGVTRLGTARITNLAGAGPMNCHPGWMLGRTTYRDKMSLSISYFEDYFDTPSVGDFLDRLEEELFD